MQNVNSIFRNALTNKSTRIYVVHLGVSKIVVTGNVENIILINILFGRFYFGRLFALNFDSLLKRL